MLTAIRNWVIKTMMKDQTGVVKTLPKREIIELNTQITAERMMRNGINPNDMKTVGQVENVVNQIDTPKVNVNTGVTSVKKADVMDMKGNKIPEDSKIMGGEEVSTSIDQENFLQRVKRAVDENRKSDAEIKARIEADNKKGIESIKEKQYQDAVKKEQAKADADPDYIMKIIDPEDFATGGRVGLKGGAFLNFIKNLTMNKKSPLQFGKDYMKNVKEKTLRANETGKFMDLPLAEVGIPATTGALVNNQIRKKLKAMNEDQKEENLKMFIRELENDEFYDKYPEIRDEMIADYTESLFGEKKANGGRIGLKGAGFINFLKKFKIKQSGDDVKDFLSKRQFMKDIIGNTEKNRKARQLAEIKEAMEKARKEGGYKFPEITKEEIEKKIAPILLKDRKLNADGGRIGLEGGTNEDFQNYLKERERFEKQKNIEQLFREYQEDIRRKGVMEQKQMAADGGRIGYKAGGIDKMRRLVLKAMGAGTAGIAAAKSGIFSGLGKTGAKEVAKEVVQKSTSQPPPYFFKLAEKIKMMGDDVTATTDRTIAKSLKSKDGKSEYLLEEDITSGDTIIKKINKEGDDMITDVEIMEFSKGEVVMGKNGKPVKTPDNYEEVTEANARIEGDVFNDPYYTDGIKVDEIIKEVDDTTKSIKYAQGGLAYMLGE